MRRIGALLVALLALEAGGTGSISAIRMSAAEADLRALATAIEMYRMDHGHYPSPDSDDAGAGLAALLDPTVEDPTCPGEFTGYLLKLPTDPWGRPYRYASPGHHNPDSYDLWAQGADGVVGGEGEDQDCGNWAEADCAAGHAHGGPNSALFGLWLGTGLVLCAPPYVFQAIRLGRQGLGLRDSLVGYHLYSALYVLFLLAAVLLLAAQ